MDYKLKYLKYKKKYFKLKSNYGGSSTQSLEPGVKNICGPVSCGRYIYKSKGEIVKDIYLFGELHEITNQGKSDIEIQNFFEEIFSNTRENIDFFIEAPLNWVISDHDIFDPNSFLSKNIEKFKDYIFWKGGPTTPTPPKEYTNSLVRIHPIDLRNSDIGVEFPYLKDIEPFWYKTNEIKYNEQITTVITPEEIVYEHTDHFYNNAMFLKEIYDKNDKKSLLNEYIRKFEDEFLKKVHSKTDFGDLIKFLCINELELLISKIYDALEFLIDILNDLNEDNKAQIFANNYRGIILAIDHINRDFIGISTVFVDFYCLCFMLSNDVSMKNIITYTGYNHFINYKKFLIDNGFEEVFNIDNYPNDKNQCIIISTPLFNEILQ